MSRAYNEMYLDDAMRNLGEAVDYAVNSCGLAPDEFSGMFMATGIAHRFGMGEPKLVSGMSGIELVMFVMREAGAEDYIREARYGYELSKEYWSGYSAAYYQWYKGCSFKKMFNSMKLSKLISLYNTLHEASLEKTVDVIDKRSLPDKNVNKIKEKRILCGMTQKELSENSGVNLRTLQQYETDAKDINKAGARMVAYLALALGCRVEDLLDIK